MTLSFDQMKHIKAREIDSLLARQISHARQMLIEQESSDAQNADGSDPTVPNLAAPSFGLGNPIDLDRRHKSGLASVRKSTEVSLALGVVEFHTRTRDLTQRNAAVADWYRLTEPVFAKHHGGLRGNRYRTIFSLVSEFCDIILEQYGVADIPFPAVLNLAGASVTAYGSGFVAEP